MATFILTASNLLCTLDVCNPYSGLLLVVRVRPLGEGRSKEAKEQPFSREPLDSEVLTHIQYSQGSVVFSSRPRKAGNQTSDTMADNEPWPWHPPVSGDDHPERTHLDTDDYAIEILP